MNNQAAQTMPLPAPNKIAHDLLIDLRAAAAIGRHITGDEIHEIEQRMIAALSQTAGVAEGCVCPAGSGCTKPCNRGWRRILSEARALPPSSRDNVLDFIEREMLAAAPAASGGEEPSPNWCTTCQKHRNDPAAIFCSNAIHRKNHTPPAGASVSERARKIITEAIGFEFGKGELQPVNDCDMEGLVEAIERALSSPRQEGEAVAWNIPCGACDCGIYDAQALAAFNGEIPKCKNHDRQCVGAVHAMQTTQPSTAASTQGIDPFAGITYHDEKGPQGTLDRLRRYAKEGDNRRNLLGQTMNEAAHILSRLLTSPTTGADGGGE